MRIKPLENRVIYDNNPLAEVVCQVRFAPLQVPPERLDAFTAALDRAAYPHNFTEDVTTFAVQIGPTGATPQQPEVSHQIRHFLSEDREWKVTSAHDFVALTCTKYHRWEQFLERLSAVLRTAREAFGAPHVLRVGLRYRDVIDRGPLGLEGVTWTELLSPFILGPFASPELMEESVQIPEADVLAHNFQSVLRLDDCNVLVQGALMFSQAEHRQAFMIDTDFYQEGEALLEYMNDLQGLQPLLVALHKNAGGMFRALIREKLHDALRPRPVDNA